MAVVELNYGKASMTIPALSAGGNGSASGAVSGLNNDAPVAVGSYNLPNGVLIVGGSAIAGGTLAVQLYNAGSGLSASGAATISYISIG